MPNLEKPADSEALSLPDQFDSLAEMKEAHRRLLRFRLTGTARFPGLVQRFLAAGSALGALLDVPIDREAAQGMLDYWGATHALAANAAAPPRSEPAVLA